MSGGCTCVCIFTLLKLPLFTIQSHFNEQIHSGPQFLPTRISYFTIFYLCVCVCVLISDVYGQCAWLSVSAGRGRTQSELRTVFPLRFRLNDSIEGSGCMCMMLTGQWPDPCQGEGPLGKVWSLGLACSITLTPTATLRPDAEEHPDTRVTQRLMRTLRPRGWLTPTCAWLTDGCC